MNSEAKKYVLTPTDKLQDACDRHRAELARRRILNLDKPKVKK